MLVSVPVGRGSGSASLLSERSGAYGSPVQVLQFWGLTRHHVAEVAAESSRPAKAPFIDARLVVMQSDGRPHPGGMLDDSPCGRRSARADVPRLLQRAWDAERDPPAARLGGVQPLQEFARQRGGDLGHEARAVLRLNQTDDWPAWADPEKVRLGQRLFQRYGMQMTLAYFTWSLPCCYAWAKAAKVLTWTGGIDKNVHRRIIETAQFVLDVMVEGGLEPKGFGVRTAQKIRLLHATIRYHVGREPKWRASEWDTPANQEDHVATLLTLALSRDDCSHTTLPSFRPVEPTPRPLAGQTRNARPCACSHSPLSQQSRLPPLQKGRARRSLSIWTRPAPTCQKGYARRSTGSLTPCTCLSREARSRRGRGAVARVRSRQRWAAGPNWSAQTVRAVERS